MAEFVSKKDFAEEQLAGRDLFFLDLLIDALCGASQGAWDKPWLKSCDPQSISGHKYQGSNQLFLSLVSQVRGYTVPVYITRDKARKMGLKIKPDAPVEFITKLVVSKYYAVNKEAAKAAGLPMMIIPSVYEKLTKEEQALYKGASRVMGWLVHNISNTDIQEVKPELYDQILTWFETGKERDDSVRIKVSALDKMVAEQSWLCPILEDRLGDAFCQWSDPCIRLPQKADFVSDDRYYETLVHEMIHSTKLVTNDKGEPIREMVNGSTTSKAREELVAEIGSAIVLNELGIHATFSKDNMQYVQGWFTDLGAIPMQVEQPNPAYEDLLDLLKLASPDRDLSPVLYTLGTTDVSLGKALQIHGLSYDQITPVVQELLEEQESERNRPTVTVTKYTAMTKEALMSEEGQAPRAYLASVVADASRAVDIVFKKGLKVDLSEMREKGMAFDVETEVDMSKKPVPRQKKEETPKKRSYSRRK